MLPFCTRYVLLFLTFIFPVIKTFAQKPYIIQAKINDLPDGTVIYLLRNEGNLLRTIATDTVKNGTFRFSDTVDVLTDYGLMGTAPGFPSQWVQIWVKPDTKVTITGSGKLLKTWDVSSEIQEQKDLAKFTAASRKQMDEIQALTAAENGFFALREGADPDKRKALKKSVDSVRVIQDSLQRLIDRNDLAVLNSTGKPGTVWMNKLRDLARSSKYTSDTSLRGSVIKLYQHLPAEERSSITGSQIYHTLFPVKVVRIGEKMADTSLMTLDGGKRSLADFKGRYLLIDFWSIGCGPCIEAMPELKKVHERFTDSLAVVSFSLDERRETWKKGVEHVKSDWTNLSDGKGMMGLAARYGVSGIPHYVIISPDGILLDSWVGYSDGLVTRKVEALLKH